jgi:hypothetical protein
VQAVVGVNPDGSRELFKIGDQLELRHLWQQEITNARWPDWQPAAGGAAALASLGPSEDND